MLLFICVAVCIWLSKYLATLDLAADSTQMDGLMPQWQGLPKTIQRPYVSTARLCRADWGLRWLTAIYNWSGIIRFNYSSTPNVMTNATLLIQETRWFIVMLRDEISWSLNCHNVRLHHIRLDNKTIMVVSSVLISSCLLLSRITTP